MLLATSGVAVRAAVTVLHLLGLDSFTPQRVQLTLLLSSLLSTKRHSAIENMTPDRSTPETDPVGIATAITIQQVGSPKKIRLGRSHDSENGPSNPSQELDSARQYHGHNKDSSLQTSGTDATSALRSAMTSAQNFTDAPIKHSLHETDGYKHRQRVSSRGK